MTERPDELDQREPPAIQHFHGEGWFNIWGIVLLGFLACVGVCIYTLAIGELQHGVMSSAFGYAAILGLELGIWLVGRWTVPYLLTKGGRVDPRSARLMRSPRSAWFTFGRWR